MGREAYINSKGVGELNIPVEMTLAKWIRGLIREGKVELFYYTDEWKELRLEVLEEHHYECQECLRQGNYSRAVCVHHINEVKDRPDLALSKYYVDHKGVKHKQLVPLCNKCHNIAHNKLGKFVEGKRFTNVERW